MVGQDLQEPGIPLLKRPGLIHAVDREHGTATYRGTSGWEDYMHNPVPGMQP